MNHHTHRSARSRHTLRTLAISQFRLRCGWTTGCSVGIKSIELVTQLRQSFAFLFHWGQLAWLWAASRRIKSSKRWIIMKRSLLAPIQQSFVMSQNHAFFTSWNIHIPDRTGCFASKARRTSWARRIRTHPTILPLSYFPHFESCWGVKRALSRFTHVLPSSMSL